MQLYLGLALFVVVACSGAETRVETLEPFVAQIMASEYHLVTVVDESTNVIGADKAPVEPDNQLNSTPVIRILDQGRVIEVGWLSRPCESQPSIHVSGTPAAMHLDVFRGPLRGNSCVDLGVPVAVQLDLRESAVDATVTYHEESPAV